MYMFEIKAAVVADLNYLWQRVGGYLDLMEDDGEQVFFFEDCSPESDEDIPYYELEDIDVTLSHFFPRNIVESILEDVTNSYGYSDGAEPNFVHESILYGSINKYVEHIKWQGD